MTLLQSITAAAAAASVGDLSPPHTNFPVISDSNKIFPLLFPSEGTKASTQDQNQTLTGSQTLTKPESSWFPSPLESDVNDLLRDLCLTLKSKLKKPHKKFTKSNFISLLNSFFEKCSSKTSHRIASDSNPFDPLNLNFTVAAIETLGFMVSREVGGLIAEGCVVFDIWDVLKSIVEKGLVGNLNSFNLIEKLTEKNQTQLVCLCVRRMMNLRATEVSAMLRFCLSPKKEAYDGMVAVRKEWEKEAVTAIEKMKGKALARDAAVLLMMAHDGFYSSEICLHYVFGPEGIDELVMSSAIARLDGFEVVGLVRYFVKWVEKYKRFPQARPCPEARTKLGLVNCECVPNLEAVLKGLKLALSEHFSYLVLNTEFREELRKIGSIVGSMATEANLCCPVDDILNHLEDSRMQESQQG